jgi:hypothetical protein
VGGVGRGAGEALVQVAADGTPTLNVGAPDDRLRNEACERRAFHVMPSVSMYVDALTQILIEQRKLMRWAVAGDGSPRGAEIEAAARRSVGRRGGTVIGDAAAADILLLAVDDAGVDAGVARAIAEGRRPDRIAGIGEAALRLPADRAAGLWASAGTLRAGPPQRPRAERALRCRWSPLAETSRRVGCAPLPRGCGRTRRQRRGCLVTSRSRRRRPDAKAGLTFRRWIPAPAAALRGRARASRRRQRAADGE